MGVTLAQVPQLGLCSETGFVERSESAPAARCLQVCEPCTKVEMPERSVGTHGEDAHPETGMPSV